MLTTRIVSSCHGTERAPEVCTLAVAALLSGCMPEGGPPRPDAAGAAVGKADGHHTRLTVADAVGGRCCTGSVEGLSRQLLEELECLLEERGLSDRDRPLFVSLDLPGVGLGTACPTFPFAQRELVHALDHALEGARGVLDITSSTRTLAQQYILYRWDRAGRCGVLEAAEPGDSSHESGLAIDILRNDVGAFGPRLRRQGFAEVAGDPGHFDYCPSWGGRRCRAGVDLDDLSIRAFQRLWNHNHDGVDNAGRPNAEQVDLIAEDGDYGPNTRRRLERSPAAGFRGGTACAASRETGPCRLASCWGTDLEFAGCTDLGLEEDYSSQRYNVHRYPVSLSPEGPVSLAVERTDPAGSWQPALVVTDVDGEMVFDGGEAPPRQDLEVEVFARGDEGPVAEIEITAHEGVDLHLHVTSQSVLTDGYGSDTFPPESATYQLTLAQSCQD